MQEKPSNTNISVRVLSPGDNGPVTQSNQASSDATAANLNATKQTADQDQTGGACPCGQGGTQVVGPKAELERSTVRHSIIGGHARLTGIRNMMRASPSFS